ncbi:polysaccharide lyase [Paraflavisolibacter sp. H34]|uniref:polysaccharide lyase n=1 Tax=Huijunlia imazamoxiresistens TaxID=3127457 RepID=UPI0030179CE6
MKMQGNFLSKGKCMFLSVLCAASLTCCSKTDLQNPSAVSNDKDVVPASRAHLPSNPRLLLEETMEGHRPFSNVIAENCKTKWTYSFCNPAFRGEKSVRFEIRKDQPLVGSAKRIRSEVTVIRGDEFPGFSRSAWYSFAIYFPSQGFEPDDTRDCINQWFEDGSDETTLRTRGDRAFLEVTPPEGSTHLKKYDLFTPSFTGAGSLANFEKIPKDKWHEFVFHFIHSKGPDGRITVWRDGKLIHDIAGRNMHLKIPKWKIGLYKASFLNGTSPHSSRVLYFDNVRVGGPEARLADMVSHRGSVIVDPDCPEGNCPDIPDMP